MKRLKRKFFVLKLILVVGIIYLSVPQSIYAKETVETEETTEVVGIEETLVTEETTKEVQETEDEIIEEKTLKLTSLEKNGWYLSEDGNWQYFEKGRKLTNSWQSDSKGWCYLDLNGNMLKDGFASDRRGKAYIGSDGYWDKTEGWRYDFLAKEWMYIASNGYAVTNTWQSDSAGLCYIGSDGYLVKDAIASNGNRMVYLNRLGYWDKTEGWRQNPITKKWLYIDSDDYVITNTWQFDSAGWCYIGSDGYWHADADKIYDEKEDKWAALNSNGYWNRKPGWLYNSSADNWMYIDNDGYLLINEWVKDSKGYCYIGSDGYWHADADKIYDEKEDKWAALNSNGYWNRKPGWLYNSSADNWMYIDNDGYLLSDEWVKDSSGWCYIQRDGYWLNHAGEAIDGYGTAIIDEDGYWTGKYKNRIVINYSHYNMTLEEQLARQVKANPQTSYYGGGWKTANESDAEFFIDPSNFNSITMDAIKVTASSLNMRSEPDSSKNNRISILNKDEVYPLIEEKNGWYKIIAKYRIGWISANYAERTVMNSNQMFQFLDLSKPTDISVNELNQFLKGKGILEGQGQSFRDGGKEHKINELYLISHALLETGNGTSHLATGVLVDNQGKLVNKDGRYINSRGQYVDINERLITEDGYLIGSDGKVTEEKTLVPYKTEEIITVYNVFGIGAYDNTALKSGAERAWREGWTSVEKAIVGGAKFVSEYYIQSKTYQQNTLYKMKWNPGTDKSYANHQYATDISWAYNQVNRLKEYYDSCTNYTLHFDIPVYKTDEIN